MEEIARFLHEHPPFSLLAFAQAEQIAGKIQIEYFAGRQNILVQNGKPSDYLYIIRRGSVDLLASTGEGGEEHVLDTLDEGEIFGSRSLMSRQPPAKTVRSREETLVYLLPLRAFDQVRRENLAFAQFFSPSVVKRLERAIQAHHSNAAPELFQLRLRDLVQNALVTVPPTATVHEAAQVMSQHNISSVVVASNPPGIVTDRDLRNRVLAVGLADTTPITAVMTSPVATLSADCLVFEGLMGMIERDIHHMPVTEKGAIVGMVTHTDILRQQSRSPMLLPRKLERAKNSQDLRAYVMQVEATVGGLLGAGARIRDIGRVVAIAHDALIKRLLQQAELELGAPPCPYAWLVLGSEGRYEQTLRTDQDNALVYADTAPEGAADYFATLAETIVSQLVAAGFPRCPGQVIATNPKWRQPLHVWQNYFERWINVPEEEALFRASIFFDYHQVYGTLDADAALRPIIKQGSKQRIFLGRLARAALRQSPPLGFFRNFVLEHHGADRDLIDLKHRGASIVVDLARLYALEAGSGETNTLTRLRVSVARSSLDKAGAEELATAFELINLLRLRNQYRLIQEGQEASNRIPVSLLSKMEQRDLKDALRAISTSQRSIEHIFQTGLFG